VKSKKAEDTPLYNPFSTVEVELLPPTVLQNYRTHQWFLWDKPLGVYREVSGAILEAIEVKNEPTN